VSDSPSSTPFAAFTLDDGYRDNLVHALPIFRRHQCPFTVFVAPAITDGTCELWWRGLEFVIAGAMRIETVIDGEHIRLDTQSDLQKQQAWHKLYWPVRRMEQHRQREWIRMFCDDHGVDLVSICRAAAMDWDELRLLAADPLCDIGAHTINHYVLSLLSEEEARHEMIASADRISQELGKRPGTFAYPYGDEGSAAAREFRLAGDAGFDLAVTTRKGLLFPGHKDHLAALPRVSLSGQFQKLRYVDVLLSGAAFAFFNGFRRLNVA
jgi:peptidoglycan/xylan/chitin deacetylase (PgdA/CDA1 family)